MPSNSSQYLSPLRSLCIGQIRPILLWSHFICPTVSMVTATLQNFYCHWWAGGWGGGGSGESSIAECGFVDGSIPGLLFGAGI